MMIMMVVVPVMPIMLSLINMLIMLGKNRLRTDYVVTNNIISSVPIIQTALMGFRATTSFAGSC